MKARIVVVTFSVDRVWQLRRCIESVALQDVDADIRHVIASENTVFLEDSLADFELAKRVSWHKISGEAHMDSSSPRMARLRESILHTLDVDFVCFLDDDNEFEPEHLQSLLETTERYGIGVVHSWRKLYWADGSAFDGMSYPWHPDAVRAKEMWEWCIRHSVMQKGSNIMRDGHRGPEGKGNISTVDMNEWLFDLALLRRIGFDTEFTENEIRNMVGEDDKLFQRVRRSGIEYECTGKATVRYYLGGVSNDFQRLVIG